jgi:hypothetical protein
LTPAEKEYPWADFRQRQYLFFPFISALTIYIAKTTGSKTENDPEIEQLFFNYPLKFSQK